METLNFAVAKSRNPRLPDTIARNLLGEDVSPWLRIARTDEDLWRLARDKFRVFSKAGLSFTDCASIAAIEELRLDAIVSFDSGFDGIVNRILS